MLLGAEEVDASGFMLHSRVYEGDSWLKQESMAWKELTEIDGSFHVLVQHVLWE